MKIETKIIYRCEFCKKYGLSKGGMKRHELICFHNPENKRPCFECNFLSKKTTTIHHDSPMGGDIEEKVTLFYCKKKEAYLYTPQNDIRRNWKDTGEESISMPIECTDFKEREY